MAPCSILEKLETPSFTTHPIPTQQRPPRSPTRPAPVELLHGQTHRLRQRRHVARLAAQRLPQLLEVLVMAFNTKVQGRFILEFLTVINYNTNMKIGKLRD